MTVMSVSVVLCTLSTSPGIEQRLDRKNVEAALFLVQV